MIDSAVAGAAPFSSVRLIVFQSLLTRLSFSNSGELLEKLAITIPNEHTERLQQKLRTRRLHSVRLACSKVIRNIPDTSSMLRVLIGPGITLLSTKGEYVDPYRSSYSHS
jgi:hypothetical protein